MSLVISASLMKHAEGCLAISEDGLIGVNNEAAVIIWDKAHKTEHFIRSVELDSNGVKAGFLVPTPTVPELALADSRIFDLAEKYMPEMRSLPASLTKTVPASNTDGIEPRVISEQQIGDYHAVVLDASDSQGLGDWLKKNGYPWSESCAQWLAPYLAEKWKITAFKLQRTETGKLGTKAIRMSFTTDRPFFPYREPAEASKLGGAGRTLRIAFLGDERVMGKLEDGTDWPAQIDFSGPTVSNKVDPNDWLKYAGLSDRPDIKLPARLTYFTDFSNPRPGKSDLFFSSNPDQSDYTFHF